MRKFVNISIVFLLLIANSHLLFAQNNKNNETTDWLLANQYIEQGKITLAVSLLEDLTKKHFKYTYYKSLKNAYTQLGETKKIETLIKQAIKKDKGNTIYRIDLGVFYLNNNKSNKAEKEFNKLLNNLQANNSQIIQTANYFSSNSLYDYAEKTYLKAREIFKDKTKYTYELSRIYQLANNNTAIAKEYLLLLEQNPNALHQIEVNINNLFNQDKDKKLYETISETVLEKIKSEPDNAPINQLYYWLLMQQNDYERAFIQAKAISKRFKETNFQTLTDFAFSSQNAQQYQYSLQAYDYLLKQKTDENFTFFLLRNRLTCLYQQYTKNIDHSLKETTDLQKEYEQVLVSQGYTQQTSDIMQQYSELLAYNLQKPQQAVDLLDSIINMKQVPKQKKAECKLIRADIYLINGDIWEASLTYSQVDKEFKNETIGSQAKFRNAMLSYYTGDFAWAESQFDALRSSTTKLIANDAMEYSLLIKENIDQDSTYKALSWFAKSEFALYQNKKNQAKTYLDSIDTWYDYHPLFDEVLYKRAEIAIKEQNYQKADSLLQDIILKYPYDLMADDAIMLLAKLNEEKLLNKNKAKQYYEKIILDYPSSLYIQQARKKYKEYEKQ